jgi:murein DD-endopeptidase MepM/ murein hydrolase activator NlpD
MDAVRGQDHQPRARRRAAELAAVLAFVGAAWPGCDGSAPASTDTGDPTTSASATPGEAPPTEGDEHDITEDEPEPTAELPPGVDHTLQEGETLWQIARAYGVTVSAIMEANRLRPRSVRRLRPGSTLRVPGATEPLASTVPAPAEPEELPPVTDGAYHELAPGQTLWDLARLYEVEIDAIMTRNSLDDESVRLLRPGRSLVIPGATRRQVERVNRNRAAPPSPARGFRHSVTRGETIWDLAGAFGVTVGEIMAANGLDEDGVRNLREGAQLYIPGVARDRGGRVRRQLTRAQRRAVTLARQLGLGTRAVAQALLRGRVEPRWARAAGRGDRTPGHLRWPVSQGWFVRGFGSGEGGYHLAVDIMGRIGWNVRASAPGIVAYSGDEVPGYGNMVMIVHPGGWVTMYAHNSANSVVAGQRVVRGAIIGEVGSTGISRGPHVHFEFMHDGRNCDPAALFRPGIRHRDGHLTPMPRAEWVRASDRPEQVRCLPRRRHPNSRWVVHERFDEHDGGP